MFPRPFGFGFGVDPFANDPFFQDPFFRDPFGQHQQFQQQHQHQQQQQQHSRPHIEEVDGDHSEDQSHDGPIVQEPDDEPQQHSARQSRNSTLPQQRHSRQATADSSHPQAHANAHLNAHRQAMIDPFASFGMMSPFGSPFGHMGSLLAGMNPATAMGGNGFVSSSFQSSSFSSSGGGQPVVYSSSTTTKIGPGGVSNTQQFVETQRTERDSRTGIEKVEVSRKLGDKERSLIRERDNTGREVKVDNLVNLRQDELDQFEQEWQTTADQAFASPLFRQGSASRQQLPSASQSSRLALPSNVQQSQSQYHSPSGHQTQAQTQYQSPSQQLQYQSQSQLPPHRHNNPHRR